MPTVWAHFVVDEVRLFAYRKELYVTLEFILTCGFLFLGGLLVLLMYLLHDSQLLLWLAILLLSCGGIPLFCTWLRTVIPYFIDNEEDSHEDPEAH